MVDLTACLRGEKRAWDAFVAQVAPIILAAVRRTLISHSHRADKGLAEDIAQDVFVRLVEDDFRLLRRYDPARASLSTWLTLVARGTTLNQLRRRRIPTVPVERAQETASRPPPDGIELPLDLLSPRQRLVLRLLYDDELSVKEAAEALGVAPQTIRSTKHKAIARLRGLLENRDREIR